MTADGYGTARAGRETFRLDPERVIESRQVILPGDAEVSSTIVWLALAGPCRDQTS